MTAAPPERGGKGRIGVRAAGVVILGGAAVVLYDAIRIGSDSGFGPQQSGFFPLVVGIGLLACGLAFLVRITVWPDKGLFAHAAEEHTHANWLKLWSAVGTLILYALLLGWLGYILATALFFVGLARLVGSTQLLRDVIVGVGFSVAAYYSFTEFLGVQLPAGLFASVL